MSNPNAAQQDFWSTTQGQRWIEHEDALDAAAAGILDRLLEKIDINRGEHVLDVGCGTGACTRAIAVAVGDEGQVTGLDISQPLLDRARFKSIEAGIANADFVLSDAQTHPFEANTYDAIFSRFGVMFFADPVAAFRNLASGLKPNGRMIFAAWAAVSENPWFLIARDAAVARLGKPSPADPNAPGPVAFQDAERVIKLMTSAGLKDVRCETEIVQMTPLGTAEDAANLVSKIGPAMRIIKELEGDEADQVAINSAITTAFKDYETENGLRVKSTINFFSATRA